MPARPRAASVTAPARPVAQVAPRQSSAAPPRRLLVGGVAGALVLLGVLVFAFGDDEPPVVQAELRQQSAVVSARSNQAPQPALPVAAKTDYSALESMVFGGRRLHWWRERLDRLSLRTDEQAQSLFAATRKKLERMGFVVHADDGVHTIEPTDDLYDRISKRSTK